MSTVPLQPWVEVAALHLHDVSENFSEDIFAPGQKWRVEMASVSGRHGSRRRALVRPGMAQGITHGRAIHSPRTVGKNGNKWEFFAGLRSRSRDPGPPNAPASQAQ
jgi:hypothetical protein